MNRSVAFITAAALGLGASTTAQAYSAVADVTFAWAEAGTSIGWTGNGINTLPDPTGNNDIQLLTAGGNNSTAYYNADFATNSDYEAGDTDDCQTLQPGYEIIELRKYACRQVDGEVPPYYTTRYHPVTISDQSDGAAAQGRLFVTDTTMTGTLTVVSTTDEPTGATTTFNLGVRTSNSPEDGFDGYNVRTADGSPFGNAWYGVTTSATLSVNLTGTFTATDWDIDGGTVAFNDPGFACAQGGLGGDARGTLCTPSVVAGGFSPTGGHLSWGVDLDGAATGTSAISHIDVRDSAGTATIVSLSGVLAAVTVDGGGAIATTAGEFRAALGSAGNGCPNHIRYGDSDPGAGTSVGISCGTLSAGSLNITGTIVPPFPGFVDATNVALSSPITSNVVAYTGTTAAAAIGVSGDASSEYSIGCNGTFTAAGGTIDPGEVVCVRHTSAAAQGTAVDTTLDIDGVTDTFTSTTTSGPPDTTPDAFAFTDVDDVPVSTQQTSNAITVSGINTAAPISVTDGEYSIDGGAFTAADGTVNDGQSVVVRHTSSATQGTAVNTVLDIGGVTDTFTSTTVPPPDTTPDAFSFTDQTGVDLDTEIESNSITVAGISEPAAISITGGEYSVNGGAYTSAAGTVNDGDDVTVRHTSASAEGTAVSTVLTIGGVSDTFTSTTFGGGGLREDDGGSSLDALLLALLGSGMLLRRRKR
jgi:hypothetical protein